MSEPNEKPSAPELPQYVRSPLERQSPESLEAIAKYATELAAWKREKRKEEFEKRRAEEAITEEQRETLEEQSITPDPQDYDGVPNNGAYVTVKETKPGYRYFYWQWRDGDTWKNEYIAPVSPKES